jgi:hypothetical protein
MKLRIAQQVDQGEGKQKYKVQDGRPEVCHLFLLISGHYDCGVRFARNDS